MAVIKQKIVPHLWFDREANAAANFYCSVFPDSSITSTTLILADISGFTALMTATDLEHGTAIVTDLLEGVIQRISPPLEIQEIEGDAVFALAALQ